MPEDALIGRRLELDAIVDSLKAARSGQAGTVLVRGEAGIGKSRLIREALAQAELLGCRVLYGRAGEFERDVPYGVIRDALAPALDGEHDRQLKELVDIVSAAIGIDVTAVLPTERNPGEVLQLAYGAGERLLRHWADRQPVVMALDDLHAADEDTLGLLSLLTRHLRGTRILILGAYRAHPPDLRRELEALVDRLARDGFVRVLDVGPLDGDDVRALATLRLDAAVDDEAVELLWDWSRGNPFFLEEAVHALRSSGRLEISDGRCIVTPARDAPPISLRNAVLYRIFRLGPDVRALAGAASVVQRIPFERLHLVAELASTSPETASRSLDELVRANVLDYAEGAFTFVHPIVRAALYEDLGPAERRRLHGVVARRLRGSDDVQPVDLALHVWGSASKGDREAAAALVAAGDATRYVAPVSAAAWYGRAVELMASDDRDRARILARRTHALYLAGRLEDAADLGVEALDILSERHDRARVATLVVAALTFLGRLQDGLSVADELLATEAGPLPRVHAARSAILIYVDRFAEAEEAAGQALAGSKDDRVAGALALGQLAASAYAQGQAARCLRLLDEQMDAAEKISPSARLSVLATRSLYLAQSGHLQDASKILDEASELSEELGGAAFRSGLDLAHTFVEFLSGRWDDALDRASWTVVELERSGQLLTSGLVRAVQGTILAERGAYAEARATLEAAEATRVGASFTAWATAGVRLALGHVDEALALLGEWWERDRSVGRLSSAALLLERLVAAHIANGDEDAARRRAREAMRLTRTGWGRVLALRARASAYGELARAREALALAQDLGLVFETAVCRLQVGTLGRRFDDEVATAHRTFTELGAEPWRRRAAGAMRDRGMTVPRRRRAAEDAFTDTETELARLVHEGMTNRQIAEALFLSPKTVEVYLSRLYQKTGCASRVELAVAIASGQIDLD